MLCTLEKCAKFASLLPAQRLFHTCDRSTIDLALSSVVSLFHFRFERVFSFRFEVLMSCDRWMIRMRISALLTLRVRLGRLERSVGVHQYGEATSRAFVLPSLAQFAPNRGMQAAKSARRARLPFL